MNKLLLSFSLLLISFSNYSQNSKIKFGVQAGLNYSNFWGYEVPAGLSSAYSESPAFAFLGGINFEYQFKEQLSLKLDLNYERKSQKADNIIELDYNNGEMPVVYNFTSKRNYDYLVLPVMLKYTDKSNFYINGGPFIGYLIKSTATNDLNISGLNTEDVDTTDYNNKVDYGLALGFGKCFELNQKNDIYLELRGNLGLANTSKGEVWNGGSVKTNSLNLIIGYTLN